MHKYEIILCWSDADAVVIAEVRAGTAGLHGPRGQPRGRALRNVNEAMRFWIDAACELGKPIPEPKGKRLPCG